MKNFLIAICFCFSSASVNAELKVHSVFGDNMVMQRGKQIQVWGQTEPGQDVTVQFANQKISTTAKPDGKWTLTLNSMAANANPQTMKVVSAGQSIEFNNILIGDVWLCGGQSNMEFELQKIYQGDVEIASARHKEIRLLTIPRAATRSRQTNFEPLKEFNSWNGQYEDKGSWKVCSPESVRKFASIGYIFARRLHLATGIPIGVIDNSVGGTTVEGWTSRESLASIPEAKGLIKDWDQRIADWDAEKDLADRVTRWEADTKRRIDRGEKPRPKPTDLRPGPGLDRNNPGGSFNGMVACFAGFKLAGIIFHQGYNNALSDARPRLYAKSFQAMIQDWRNAFDEPNLPFGIIELCAGAEPQTPQNFELRMVDAGPYIREAQFKAYQELDNIGWACAYDQQVNWYHPQMKVMLAERIARWALANQYDLKIGHEPAMLLEHTVQDNQIILTFDRELTVRDGRPIAGMAIASGDKRFFPADATFVIKQKDNRGRDVMDFRRIQVSHPLVNTPVAVRYAWARCPLGNLTNRSHMERIIPVPSFRTDDWDWVEAPFGPDQRNTRRTINEWRKAAREFIDDRMRREAELQNNK